MIVAGFAEAKKDHGYELIQKLEAGVQDMQQIVEDWKRDVVAPKKKEILQYDCVFCSVLDGYNAPVTVGNFVDLVERHFYDGMEIQRCKTSNFPHNIYSNYM
ncbi:unnamed protein product [Brassica oleracea]